MAKFEGVGHGAGVIALFVVRSVIFADADRTCRVVGETRLWGSQLQRVVSQRSGRLKVLGPQVNLFTNV